MTKFSRYAKTGQMYTQGLNGFLSTGGEKTRQFIFSVKTTRKARIQI